LTRRTSYFDNANGEGIEIVEFDKEALSFRRVSVTSGIDNPAYLAFNPVTNMIYANSEVEGWNEGTVSAYRYDVATGKLTYMNKQPTLGSIAAHNILDAAGTNLFVTNYSHENDIELPRKATAMFALNADGSIAPCRASVTHHGSGPDPVRQRVAHPHGAVPHPDGKLVSVADLGLDSVFHYAFDETTGDMIEAPASITRLAPGCGPRHLLMSADGATIYVINELNSTVSVLRKSGAGTEWAEVQVVSTLPRDFEGTNLCAAIQMSPDGTHIYASNRGHDSLACFSVDAGTGALSKAIVIKTGGRTPRSFAISDDGNYVVVANQNSHELVSFRRSGSDGSLEPMGSKYAIGTPMCVIPL
jgi:6-phosphogluconolactonase